MTSSGALRRLGMLVGPRLLLMAITSIANASPPLPPHARLAAECKSLHNLASPWHPASPWISSTAQASDVLANREARVITSFKSTLFPNVMGDYELVIAGHWSEGGDVNERGWAATNIRGIAMMLSVNGLVLKPSSRPVVLIKYAIPALGNEEYLEYARVLMQLVLTGSPGDLPSGQGPIAVTGFGPNVTLTMYELTVLKDAYQVGQQISGFPSYPGFLKACVSNHVPPFSGSRIMQFGGGAGLPVIFSNACEVNVTQAKEVRMGAYSLRDFPEQGSLSEKRPFDITLGKCSASAKPRISFTAKNGASHGATVLNLDPGPDPQGQAPARGFGIVLTQAVNNQRIQFGKSYEMSRIDPDGATIRLHAAYLRTVGGDAGMAGGHANGTAEFTVEFP